MRWRNAGTNRIACFDIENKPGTYGPGDYTHPKVTAIAVRFTEEPRGASWVFTREKPGFMRDDAEAFRQWWDRSDMVMGHNIRRHDRKILDGMYTALDLPLLADRPMIDTYCDLPKMAGLSRSLENLAARWGCPVQKMSMPEHVWEAAYDGVPWAVKKMRERVESDVRINIWIWGEERRRGLLP